MIAIAEWARRCDQEVLTRLGCPFGPFVCRYRAPGERTLWDAFAKVDPGALTAVGFARLTALASPAAGPLNPDGVPNANSAVSAEPPCLPRPGPAEAAGIRRGRQVPARSRPRDGSRMFVLTAVRNDDATTAALREIDAKTNEIPEFAPLLDTIDNADLHEAVIRVEAMHAQKDHARYLVEDRHAHYSLSVRDNQPMLAGQLRNLPWGRAPVLDRSRDRGNGREEAREMKVVSVGGLLFPHARQVVHIHRKRRPLGAKKWLTETVYAVTDLPARQATPAEIASWARGHRIIENTRPLDHGRHLRRGRQPGSK